jgi:hypothetical protein
LPVVTAGHDERLHRRRAPRAVAEQAAYGSSGTKHADRDSADDALKKPDAMAKLAKDAKKMSPEELAEFQRTMAKYKNAELFAAQFAAEPGGKETLEFWNCLAEIHAGARGEELKQLQSIQKDLRMALARATLSDADARLNPAASMTDVMKEAKDMGYPV